MVEVVLQFQHGRLISCDVFYKLLHAGYKVDWFIRRYYGTVDKYNEAIKNKTAEFTVQHLSRVRLKDHA